MLVVCTKCFASDNVLQAIQIDGVKDSYNIILKSDDTAELKKTVQAPNKIILSLNGIRASKTINTIYNNTSTIDSVVVEPTGDESVRILVQGQNVGDAQIHFDTLKTPLGVLESSIPQKRESEIVLSEPMQSYKPVYQETQNETSSFSLEEAMASPAARYTKKILKNEKISWLITFGLFSILLLGGLKTVKGKDNDIKVGLTQSLKERELDLYRQMNAESNHLGGVSQAQNMQTIPISGNYGLKAYQNETKNPYVSSEIQRPRPISLPNKPTPAQNIQALQQKIATGNLPGASAVAAKNSNVKTAMPQTTTKPKVANIDSMKFLESMTKIYEKNGRSDLAQELKTNMKKAKVNLV